MEIPLRHSALLAGSHCKGDSSQGKAAPSSCPMCGPDHTSDPGAAGRASWAALRCTQLVWCHQQKGRPGAARLGARRRVQPAPQPGSALATFFPSRVAIQTFLSQQDYNSASQRSR